MFANQQVEGGDFTVKKVAAVILAAGVGSRMKSDKTKQKIEIFGKSVLRRTIEAFDRCALITSITVVTRNDEIDFVSGELEGVATKTNVIVGGSVRAESARLGFAAIPTDSDFVAIHDAARCLVTEDMIKSVAEAAFSCGAATAATCVYDTLKRVGEDGFIVSTEKRQDFMRAQTPQIFSVPIYREALKSISFGAEITDDNMLVEALGQKIRCVDTGSENIKITEPSDVAIAESLLLKRAGRKSNDNMEIRVGHGYDVHRFEKERKLILGGVEIPHETGLLGHSDADVLVHAIMDALLGAAALGDIGKHFPDSSAEFKGISSIILLTRVRKLVDDAGYRISNVDATLVLQKPKIAPYIDKMCQNVAFALGVDPSSVNVKATTEEKLGFTGACEGAAAHAVALIQK